MNNLLDYIKKPDSRMSIFAFCKQYGLSLEVGMTLDNVRHLSIVSDEPASVEIQIPGCLQDTVVFDYKRSSLSWANRLLRALVTKIAGKQLVIASYNGNLTFITCPQDLSAPIVKLKG